MKKILALLLCLLMVLSLAFSMTACDEKKDDDDDKEKTSSEESKDDDGEEDDETPKTPEELIIGKWVLTYTAEDLGLDMDDIEDSFPEDFNVPEFKLKCIMEFTDDEMTLSFDKSSFEDYLDDFKKAIKDYAKDNDIEVTDDDIDELFDEAFGGIDSVFDTKQTAEYRIDGDEIILIMDGDEDAAEFEVTKDTLTIDDGDTTMELKRK